MNCPKCQSKLESRLIQSPLGLGRIKILICPKCKMFGTSELWGCIEQSKEPFEIKEPGIYKTRDGRKVFISIVNKYAYGIFEYGAELKDWYLNGYWGDDPQPEDIVSKWE